MYFSNNLYWQIKSALGKYIKTPPKWEYVPQLVNKLERIEYRDIKHMPDYLKAYKAFGDFPLEKVVKTLGRYYDKQYADTPEGYATVNILCMLAAVHICIMYATPFNLKVAGHEITLSNVKFIGNKLLISVGTFDDDYTSLDPKFNVNCKKAVALCKDLGIDVTYKKLGGFFVFYINLDSFIEYKESYLDQLRIEKEIEENGLGEFDPKDPLKFFFV